MCVECGHVWRGGVCVECGHVWRGGVWACVGCGGWRVEGGGWRGGVCGPTWLEALLCPPLSVCSAIRVKPRGLSRGVRKLVKSRVPDLSKYHDISEYVLG